MDDKQFIEAYNEVILENMNSVLKQNLIFQTQLKFVEVKDKEMGELKDQLAKFQGSDQRVSELQSEVNNLRHQLNSKDDELKKNAGSDAERHRLQNAVNSQMKEIEALKSQVSSLEAQQKEKEASAKEQQEYITKLEDMLPKTKKKQLGIETEQVTTQETQNTVKTNGDIFSLSSTGGTF
jgi:predicted  nucleic acid-binding Zn-ribbon protein